MPLPAHDDVPGSARVPSGRDGGRPTITIGDMPAW